MFINSPLNPEVEVDFNIYLSFIDVFSNLIKDAGGLYLLAGGAPRSLFVGDVPTDYDVFINLPIDTIESLCDSYSVQRHHKSVYANSDIFGVTTISYKGITIQLISMEFKEYSEVIDTFPCSLSEAYYDGGCITLSTSFLQSFLNNIIYFKSSCDIPYKYKIMSYFPNMSIQEETTNVI